MYNIGIYKLISPSGKIYIGQSNDIKYRFSKYKCLDCKNQTKLYNALKKYGFSQFKVEILFSTSGCFKYTQNILNILEIKYIKQFDAINSGYNIREGGSNGKISDSTKQKMRESALLRGTGTDEANLTRLKTLNIGRKHTEEARLNYSKAAKLKNLKPVLQYDLLGNFISEYKSVKEAKELNKGCSKIDAVCRGERDTAGVYKWKFKEMEEPINE